MKKRSIPFIAFLFFSCLLGALFGYMYGSLGDKNKTSTISFDDLPKNTQKMYIKKDEVAKMQTLFSTKREDIAPIDEPIKGSNEELKSQIIGLREINQELYMENVELSDKGWELALKLKEKEKEVLSEKERLKSKSLENINEAEQQHYQNVNDLTKRINQLQKQAIESTKSYENEIVKLESQVDTLKQDLQKKEFDMNEVIDAAAKKERLSKATLAEKNRHMLEQIKTMKAKMTQQLEQHTKDIKNKKDEISQLKQGLSDRDIKNNSLQARHTKELFEVQQRHTEALKKLKEQIKELQSQHKEELAFKNNEISTLLSTKQKKIKKLRTAKADNEAEVKTALLAAKNDMQLSLDAIVVLKKQNDTLRQERDILAAQLKTLEEKIHAIVEKKEQEYASLLKELKGEASSYIQTQNKTIVKLERQIIEDYENIDSLKSKNVALTKELKDLRAEFEGAVGRGELEKAEAKHAQNYKILNTKIITLKREKDSFIGQMQQNIEKFRTQIAQKDTEIIALKNSANTFDKNKEQALQAQILKQEEQLKFLRERSMQKDNELKRISSEYGEKLAFLEKELEQSGQDAQSKKTTTLAQELSQKDSNLTLSSNQYRQKIALLEKELKETKSNTSSENKELIRQLDEKNDRLALLEKNDRELGKEKFSTKEEFLAQQKEKNLKLQKSLERSMAKVASLEDDVSLLIREKRSLIAKNKELSSEDNFKEKLEIKSQELVLAKERIKALSGSADLLKDEKLKIAQEQKLSIATNDKSLKSLKKLLQDTNLSLQNVENKVMSLKGDIVVLKKTNQDLLERNKALMASKKETKANNEKTLQSFNALNSDLINRKAEVLALKDEFNSLTKTNLKLQAELEKSKSAQLAPIDSKVARFTSLEEENDKLVNENIELLKELESLKGVKSSMQQKTKNISNKPVLQSSVQCDDMKEGTNSPTLTCKEKVREFLTIYGNEYFFEVVPIVDNGGIASLEKIATSNLGIPKSEITRLTRLSSLGLGKDRAASGGKLIEEILGDFARISYAIANKYIPKKRGFVINAYK